MLLPLDFITIEKEETPPPFWEEIFGPYPWFVVPFLGDLLKITGLRVAQLWENYRYDAVMNIPPEWRKFSTWGDWENLSQVQFKSCISQGLVRLDKSAFSIILTGVANFHLNNNSLPKFPLIGYPPYSSYQTILPSCFTIESQSRINIRDDHLVEEISKLSMQSRLVIQEAFRGYGLIESVAHDIVDAFRELSGIKLDVRLMLTRKGFDGNQLKKPVLSQRIHRERICKFHNIELE
ncbi:hypothetical protein [Rhizobium sp. Leaf371]|uniref:hypothetical protein n=1 Tax=Rhizobium sp. Leaf371 TaxID=1736355 RepID=UPI001AEC5020|nr:hypothetical protein [Rhizobium sp. Leaf371]